MAGFKLKNIIYQINEIFIFSIKRNPQGIMSHEGPATEGYFILKRYLTLRKYNHNIALLYYEAPRHKATFSLSVAGPSELIITLGSFLKVAL